MIMYCTHPESIKLLRQGKVQIFKQGFQTSNNWIFHEKKKMMKEPKIK